MIVIAVVVVSYGGSGCVVVGGDVTISGLCHQQQLYGACQYTLDIRTPFSCFLFAQSNQSYS